MLIRLFVFDFTANPVLILLTIPGLIIFTALRPVRVKSAGPVGSMSPTMAPGDFILMDGLVKRLRKPLRRGDIIMFTPPPEFVKMSGEQDPFIKRIIGVAGDCIKVANGRVSINNEQIEETYTSGSANYELEFLKDLGGYHNQIEYRPYNSDPDSAQKPILVPEGKLFVLGDNRTSSVDSHIFGFVDVSDVHARYLDHLWRAPVAPYSVHGIPECSYCRKDQTQVRMLIQADENACICDNCVDLFFQQSCQTGSQDSQAATESWCHICRQNSSPLFGPGPRICRACISNCLNLLKRDETMGTKRCARSVLKAISTSIS
jgi:signal peptidase I